MNAYPLHPSPLTMLRVKNRLSLEEAAQKLGYAILEVARLESLTRRIPVRARRVMSDALNPPERWVQLTIFDALDEEGGRHV